MEGVAGGVLGGVVGGVEGGADEVLDVPPADAELLALADPARHSNFKMSSYSYQHYGIHNQSKYDAACQYLSYLDTMFIEALVPKDGSTMCFPSGRDAFFA